MHLPFHEMWNSWSIVRVIEAFIRTIGFKSRSRGKEKGQRSKVKNEFQVQVQVQVRVRGYGAHHSGNFPQKTKPTH